MPSRTVVTLSWMPAGGPVAAPDRNSATACAALITRNPPAIAGPGGSLAGNRTARCR